MAYEKPEFEIIKIGVVAAGCSCSADDANPYMDERPPY